MTIADRLAQDVGSLRFRKPVSHVYNPLVYARPGYEEYVRRYGSSPKEVIFVGMNPGPWGMAQTGVPFGAVGMVRDWLGIHVPIGKPPREHPKRPVLGFECKREEISGLRLWRWIRERFGTPEKFFARFFVANYCPLMFLEASGRNRTPDKLPAAEREPLLAACDEALARLVEALRARYVIGVGAFATKRARAALGNRNVTVGSILHPSPASPAANRHWAATVEKQLSAMGIL